MAEHPVPVTRPTILGALTNFALILTILLLGLNAWLFWTNGVTVAPPARISFGRHSVIPVDHTLCPGDTLIFDQEVTIGAGRTAIDLVYSWWDADHFSTPVPDGAIRRVIQSGPVTFTNHHRHTVPALPPGNYEFRVAALQNTGNSAFYAVPFSVPEGCP